MCQVLRAALLATVVAVSVSSCASGDVAATEGRDVGATDRGGGTEAGDAQRDGGSGPDGSGVAADAAADAGGPDAAADAGGADAAADAGGPVPADAAADAGGPVQTDAAPEAATDASPDALGPCESTITAYSYDFATTQAWTHQVMDGVTGSWTFDHWEHGLATSGPGACHSGSACWATNLDDNYIQCQRAALRSPSLDLSACAGRDLQLAFWHWYDFWSGFYYDRTYYDGGVVEFSTDGGSTWAAPPGVSFPGVVDINPDRGASYACLLSDGFHVDGLPGYTGASGGWQRVVIPIPPAYRTASFAVRFAYGSGVSYETTNESTSMAHARPGWYLDDVAVEAP
jgi:hypothetical protein